MYGPVARAQIGIWLFVLTSLVYMSTFSGTPISTDEVSLFTGARSLAQRGLFSATPLYWNQHGTVRFGETGHAYPNFEPGQMVLSAPLYLLANLTQDTGLLHAVWLFNVLVTAGTVCLVYICGLRLNYSVGVSVTLALLYAFGSIAFPYAQTYFREPLSAFGLMLAYVGLLGIAGPKKGINAVVMGTALGLAYLTKQSNLAVVPVFVFAACFSEGVRSRRRTQVWILALAVVPIVLALLSAQAMGNLNDIGRVDSGSTRPLAQVLPHLDASTHRLHSFSVALIGLLFSPGKSVFLYTPFSIVALFGFRRFLRRDWRAALIAGGTPVILLLGYAYSTGTYWFGGLNWGPRFLVPATPFLLLPALAILDRYNRMPLLPRLGIAVMAIAGFSLQLLAILVPIEQYVRAVQTIAPDAMWTIAIYNWIYTPLFLYPALLGKVLPDFVWLREFQSDGRVDWLFLSVVGIGMAVSGLMLWRSIRRPSTSRFHLAALALPILAAAIMLHGSVDDPRLPGGNDRLVLARLLDQSSESGDAVVISNHTLVNFYLNVLRTPARVYSITPQGDSLESQYAELFKYLNATHERVWLVSDDSPQSREGPWLLARPDEAWWVANSARLHELVTSPYARATLYVGGREADTEPSPRNFLTENSAPDVRANRIVLRQVSVEKSKRWVSLNTQWVSDATPLRNYTIYLHLIDASGALVWQDDSQPQFGFSPTSIWLPGETVRHLVAFSTENLVPGTYRLVAGMYYFDENGNIHNLEWQDRSPTLDLATIMVD